MIAHSDPSAKNPDKNKEFDKITCIEDIENINRKVIAIADKLGKPVVATCDVHFIDPEDAKYRAILMAAQALPTPISRLRCTSERPRKCSMSFHISARKPRTK